RVAVAESHDKVSPAGEDKGWKESNGERRRRVGTGKDGPCRCPKLCRPHTGEHVLRFQPVMTAPATEPSALCSRYSTSILAKSRLTCSMGMLVALLLPLVWNAVTSTSLNVHL